MLILLTIMLLGSSAVFITWSGRQSRLDQLLVGDIEAFCEGEDSPGGGENEPGGGENEPGGGENNPGGGESENSLIRGKRRETQWVLEQVSITWPPKVDLVPISCCGKGTQMDGCDISMADTRCKSE